MVQRRTYHDERQVLNFVQYMNLINLNIFVKVHEFINNNEITIIYSL